MYERRLKVFLLVVVAGLAVIVGRLVHLQLVQGRQYRSRAEALLTWVDVLPTVRGQVLDRKGRLLATDRACYDFSLEYRMLKGPGSAKAERTAYDRWVKRTVRQIKRQENVSEDIAADIFDRRLKSTWALAAELTGSTRNEMSRAAENAVRRVEAIRRRVGGPVREENLPHPIVAGLDEAQAVKVRSRLAEMVGASVLPSHSRWYPRAEDAAHVIGRLGPMTKDQDRQARSAWKSQAPMEEKLAAYLPGDAVGVNGVEKLCEQLLRGRRGYRRLRRSGEILDEIPAQFGQDVHLTLDIELQRALAGLLDRPGAIVVLDVPTGEVLAMVSLPTYDLNTYRREFKRLSRDYVDLPLWDRTVAVRYPPGSTFKPLIALGGLAYGSIGPETTIDCNGWLVSPTYKGFRCWIYKMYGREHGPLNVVGALENSCNIFFYKLGEKLTLPREVEWLGKMGFSDPPGTHLPGERAARLPGPRAGGGVGEARQLATGQGQVSVTPMHVANAMATIARRGMFRTPVLVRELASRQRAENLNVPPEAIELVQRGMRRVVSRGTARKYFLGEEIEICGKTGTAETAPRRVDSNGNGRIDGKDRVVRSGDTAWFAGFAPYRKPRIAFVVMVEYSDAGGGRTCGPIAREVVQACRGFGYLD